MCANLAEIDGVLSLPPVKTWKSLLETKEQYGLGTNKWLFRGQRVASWKLETTFERAMPDPPATGNAPWESEAAILREFTRRAHHFVADLPPPGDILEWFALLRHYGAVSRLMDFTYSLYVACYFALRDANQKETEEGNCAAVWAVNTDWLVKRFKRRFREESHESGFKRPDDFRKFFLTPEDPKLFVRPVNPYRLNERLTAQQGVFLCPGNVARPFMENLLTPKVAASPNQVIRLPIPYKAKKDFLEELRRMNITSATLFPDLAGFAQSLADWFYLDIRISKKDLKLAIKGKTPRQT